jgi:hypothetical protein
MIPAGGAFHSLTRLLVETKQAEDWNPFSSRTLLERP